MKDKSDQRERGRGRGINDRYKGPLKEKEIAYGQTDEHGKQR